MTFGEVSRTSHCTKTKTSIIIPIILVTDQLLVILPIATSDNLADI